ncbi:MAG TPA: transposase [Gaiellaceae bacterium]|nr:transposase [Gaiellaceae bacterium]
MGRGDSPLSCRDRGSTPKSCSSAASGWRWRGGRPIAHVAADLGIHKETLRKWVRQAEADQGLRPDLPTSEERDEIKRLRQENFELRRANEILKSASVFFAKELDPDRSK